MGKNVRLSYIKDSKINVKICISPGLSRSEKSHPKCCSRMRKSPVFVTLMFQYFYYAIQGFFTVVGVTI